MPILNKGERVIQTAAGQSDGNSIRLKSNAADGQEMESGIKYNLLCLTNLIVKKTPFYKSIVPVWTLGKELGTLVDVGADTSTGISCGKEWLRSR